MSIIKSPINDKDFSRGILVINTDKSTHILGNSVLFKMASLDSKGQTLCRSNLKLEISLPDQNKSIILTTKDHQIIPVSTCGDNNVTNEPDYIARYHPTNIGTYKLLFTNLDSQKQVLSSFTVQKNSADFQIGRFSATRVNPFEKERYPMVIKVTSKKNFKGKLTDTIPANFKLVWQGIAKITENKSEITLSWNVDLKAGETKEFAYDFAVPRTSPSFIKFNPAVLKNKSNITVFTEPEPWQLTISANN